jgi:hypothetical protein
MAIALLLTIILWEQHLVFTLIDAICIVKEVKMTKTLSILLSALAVGVIGCVHQARTDFSLAQGISPLHSKPSTCQVDLFKVGETPSRNYLVIGEVFAGGGDAVNPRFSGCMDIGEAIQSAKEIVCKNGGDAIISATLDSGAGCASVQGQVIVYR